MYRERERERSKRSLVLVPTFALSDLGVGSFWCRGEGEGVAENPSSSRPRSRILGFDSVSDLECGNVVGEC